MLLVLRSVFSLKWNETIGIMEMECCALGVRRFLSGNRCVPSAASQTFFATAIFKPAVSNARVCYTSLACTWHIYPCRSQSFEFWPFTNFSLHWHRQPRQRERGYKLTCITLVYFTFLWVKKSLRIVMKDGEARNPDLRQSKADEAKDRGNLACTDNNNNNGRQLHVHVDSF